MADRPGSSGQDSSKGSSHSLPVITAGNKRNGPPLEWTLSHEWTIENRESFDGWKSDVQGQIQHLTNILENSLHTYPHPDVSVSVLSKSIGADRKTGESGLRNTL